MYILLRHDSPKYDPAASQSNLYRQNARETGLTTITAANFCKKISCKRNWHSAIKTRIVRYGNRQRCRETALHDKKTQQHPKTMAEHEQWHWQEPATVWRGIGIYHVTLTITSRQPLLGTLVIPNNDPAQARVERTELGEALLDCLRSVPIFYPEIQLLQYCLMPDHIHLVWYVTKHMEHGIRYVAQGFWPAIRMLP